MSFRIDLTTGLVSVQGAPRPGLRKFGVPPGGPFDTESARHANLLLGNDAFDPVLEMALVNGDLTFERRMTFALVGSGHRAELDGQVVELCGSYEVQAGSMLKVFPVAHGLRCYLAVPGGITTAMLATCAL